MPNNRSCELQTSTVEITLEIGKERLSRAVVKQLSKNINTNLLFIDLIYDLLPPIFLMTKLFIISTKKPVFTGNARLQILANRRTSFINCPLASESACAIVNFDIVQLIQI